MRTPSSQMVCSSVVPEVMSGDATSGGMSRAATAEARIITANRDFYRQIAEKYDRCESCVSNAHLQEILEADLDKIHSCFTSLGRTPRCLDCGGGTGNLALKMLARGWNVTVVDVSDEMLGVLETNAAAKGFSPRLISSPIAQFLTSTSETFDLVAFNSVLHHLYSYTRVAELAVTRVGPRGFFYSNFDPAVPRNSFWARTFETLDITAAKFMLDPRDVLPGIWRRMRKLVRRRDSLFGRAVVSVGDLAEYHARTGVDDAQIICLLESDGFAIVEHQRYPAGRTRAAQFLNEHLRLLENFKIIARRAEEQVHMQRNGIHFVDKDLRGNPESKSPEGFSQAGPSPMRNPLKRLEEKWRYLKAQESFQHAPVLIASRLISWRARCLLQKPAIVNFPKWNVRMFLPAEWRGIAKLVFAFREDYEPEMAYLDKILSAGQVFVDVGANLGIYTLPASKIVGKRGRVLAFEPSAQSFPLLAKNIALNGLTNVLAFPVALAQKNGRAWLHRGPNPGLNSMGKDPSWKEQGEEIVTESLDQALQQARIDRVDLIKMDVQGAEELVLRGASKTLTSARPVIIFEIWPEGTALLDLPPYGAWELLESVGYEFFVVRRGEMYTAKTPPAGGNVVAIHKQQL